MSSINGKKIKDVPEMKFSEEGLLKVRPDHLVMLGGNHRRKAVRLYVDMLKRQLRGEETVLKGINTEATDELDACRKKIRGMKEVVQNACMWAIRIYDMGELIIGCVGCVDECECELNTDKLLYKDTNDTKYMFRYLSRNQIKDSFRATDEEKLIEVMDELTDYLEEDIGRGLEADGEDMLNVLYPKFCEAVKVKAEQFKDDKGYRRLCCVPSFVLGLAMSGRVARHFKHSPWFTIGRLGEMLGDYGGVSETEVIELASAKSDDDVSTVHRGFPYGERADT